MDSRRLPGAGRAKIEESKWHEYQFFRSNNADEWELAEHFGGFTWHVGRQSEMNILVRRQRIDSRQIKLRIASIVHCSMVQRLIQFIGRFDAHKNTFGFGQSTSQTRAHALMRFFWLWWHSHHQTFTANSNDIICCSCSHMSFWKPSSQSKIIYIYVYLRM